LVGRGNNWSAKIKKQGRLKIKMTNSFATYQAKQLGEKAYQLFNLPEFRGKIVAVFTSTAYLEGENGEIFWLGGADLPLHQRALTISYSSELFCAGEKFYCQGLHLQIGQQIYISLRQASLWKPAPLDPGKIPSLPRLFQIFQNWLPAFLGIDPSWRKISTRLYSLMASAPSQRIDSIIEVSKKLIGLGPGFSPAGDDFVGGLLFTLHILKKAYPDHLQLDGRKISDFLEWARSRTNFISWTILRDLSFGQGPEPGHKIMNNLLQGEDPSAIYLEIDELTQIGHTTGHAIFYGMLTGLRLILGGDNQEYLS